MNMKNRIICFGTWSWLALSSVAVLITALASRGSGGNPSDQNPDINAVKTELVDGYCIGVTGSSDSSTNGTSLDEVLVFLPWTTNAPDWIAVPAELEYAYRVELVDTNGVKVPKTPAGDKIGSRFLEFGPGKDIPLNHMKTASIGKIAGAPPLFSPYRTRDLFKIGAPGSYVLRITFQIMAFPRTGPYRGNHTNDLIRFPPLSYPILVPSKSTNLLSK